MSSARRRRRPDPPRRRRRSARGPGGRRRQLVGRRVDGRCVDVGQHHCGACMSEGLRGGQAHSGAGAGDQGDLAGEVVTRVHAVLPFLGSVPARSGCDETLRLPRLGHRLVGGEAASSSVLSVHGSFGAVVTGARLITPSGRITLVLKGIGAIVIRAGRRATSDRRGLADTGISPWRPAPPRVRRRLRPRARP
jgi:hypothetical protein